MDPFGKKYFSKDEIKLFLLTIHFNRKLLKEDDLIDYYIDQPFGRVIICFFLKFNLDDQSQNYIEYRLPLPCIPGQGFEDSEKLDFPMENYEKIISTIEIIEHWEDKCNLKLRTFKYRLKRKLAFKFYLKLKKKILDRECKRQVRLELKKGSLELRARRAKPKKTYIMLDSITNLYKIGFSVNPIKREQTLLSSRPSIKLLFVNKKNIESELHKEFAHRRGRGEWFSLDNNDIESITSRPGWKQMKVTFMPK